VFEQLYQVKQDGDAHQGSGLGLAVSKELVRLQSGDIWAESELGVGSTFTFSLPEATR
jgi:signal transduction histidine kinase